MKVISIIYLIILPGIAFLGGAMWDDTRGREYRIMLLESYIACHK